MKVKLDKVCKRIYAGGDVPKDRYSTAMTSEYTVPIYANAEKDDGLYGYTDTARENELSITVAARGTIGFTAIRREPFLPVVRLITVVPDVTKVSERYLYYALRSCKPTSSGTSIPQLTVPDIKKNEIELCSLPAQEKIADKLDVVVRIIALRQQELQRLDYLVKARFVELFGDPISNSYNLSEAMLSELGEFGRGVSKHRPRNDPKLLGGKYPLIQTGDVAAADLYISSYTSTYSELGLSQSKMWGKGTLCITIAANIAKTAILDFDACFPDSVVGFTANARTSNIFIHYWFSFFQEILESQAPESAQKNINLKILSELKVIVPPKEGQDAFVNFVEQVIKSKAVIQKALDETKLLFDSLMQEYFG